MKKGNRKKWIYILFLVVGLLIIWLGYQDYHQKSVLRKELNLEGLFTNIKDVEIETDGPGFFSDKPYSAITIKIPSVASQMDDQLGGGSKNRNELLDREKLDASITEWLKKTFSAKEAKKYTDKITVWYRDDKIVDEIYKNK